MALSRSTSGRRDIPMSRNLKTDLLRLLDAFRNVRYPDGFPFNEDEDALTKRLKAEFKDWCHQQGLAADLERAEKEAALMEAAEELDDAFAELAAQGKAQSISVPRPNGTIERRWSFISKEKRSPQKPLDTYDNN